jgi:hypothetical protein
MVTSLDLADACGLKAEALPKTQQAIVTLRSHLIRNVRERD